MDNFRYPYIAFSFQDFWKRWHISLSSFLQEYLYIPLGGNRKGKIRTYLNLMITMILGGLWHGASWSYAVWGSFHGLVLVVEKFFTKRHKSELTWFIKSIKVFYVFSMVSLSWLLFKLPEFSHVIEYLTTIFKNISMRADNGLIASILIYSTPVFLHHMYYLYSIKFGASVFYKYKFAVYGSLIFLIISNSGIPGSFIYFQF